MPLVAEDSETGERIASLALSTAGWDALAAEVRAKRRQLRMPCCGATATMRTSPLGLRHFYHRGQSSISCEHSSESADHLSLKMLVIAALTDAGWEAHPEHDEGDWRADVLAVDGDRRVAFEVQLSPQDGAETRRRHERYASSGVRCVWLMKRIPADVETSKTLPAFKIAKAKDSTAWVAELERYPEISVDVGELVSALAQGRAAHTPVRPAHLDISVFNWQGLCYRCGSTTPLVMAYAQETCRCGRDGGAWDQTDDPVGALVATAIRSGSMSLPLPGSGLQRRNSRAAGRPQWSNICTACGAMQGNFHLAEELRDYDLKPAVTGRAPVPAGLVDEAGKEHARHWCIQPLGEAPLNAPDAAREVNTAHKGSMTIDQVIRRYFGA